MTVRVFSTFYSNVLIPFRDFIYPPLCFVCDKRLENGDARVCRECWSSFRPFRVGDAVWHELKERFMKEGVVSNFLSCYYFETEGRFQQVIHLLKYQGMKTMGVMLGREIGRRIAQNATFSQADYLIPVPLHKLQQRERGYNQSEYLCKGISEITAMSIKPNLLRRTKYTQSQTRLTLAERMENVGGAFEVSTEQVGEVQGKALILVDDVITTGSTVIACARILVAAGAKSVLAASAAVAR